MINLRGKAALITGASRGIGRATAIAFAEAGADVAIHFNGDAEGANQASQEAALLGANAITVQGDLGVWEVAERVVDDAWAQLGHIDVIVANHGIWNTQPVAVEDIGQDAFEGMLAVNLAGVASVVAAGVRRMKATSTRGRVILVASTAAQRGEAFHAHYAASKGALVSFAKSLAVELADHGILVNCVAPGWVRTPMTEGVLADAKQRDGIAGSIPLGRVAEPEEIAGPIVFLASDLATFITGEVLNVNGGAVLCG
ncbi:MAG: SDR family oxidoreductase [Deltaproteobacteria bacterium]|nr:SDR family oxidoreductase [Deltaproteobacteria bacterium]